MGRKIVNLPRIEANNHNILQWNIRGVYDKID